MWASVKNPVKYVVLSSSNVTAGQDNNIVAAVAATTPAAGDNYVVNGGNTGNAGGGLNPQAGLITVVFLAVSSTGGTSSVVFYSGASASAHPCNGAWDVASGGQLILPYNPAGWFQTLTNSYLNLYPTTTAVTGILGYTVV
jgi:hypothetical protein